MVPVREFWSRHEWPAGERRYHWLVVFDDQPEVRECYVPHLPVLEKHRAVVDPVPPEWLHLTLQSLCPTTQASSGELGELSANAADRLAGLIPPRVQLGPPRIDGGAVTWAVYPEHDLEAVQEQVRQASVDVLGTDRVTGRRGRWWPHVTLAYGAADDPADDLAGALARARLPRTEITIDRVMLVDEEQDLDLREYRWEAINTVPVGSRRVTAALDWGK